MRKLHRPGSARPSLPRCRTALLGASLLLCLVGSRAVFSSRLPGKESRPLTSAQQFYNQVQGHWVGTAVSRLDGAEPVTGYFHLLVSRVDENTFREEYVFYRTHPETGALERSGTQSVLSTVGGDAVMQQTCWGNGTILIDFKPKKHTFKTNGKARSTGPHRLEAEAAGKIAVEGLPLNLGKNGKLRKATASWSLKDETLIGESRVETSFRALLFTKRYSYQTQLRAQRGADVKRVAAGLPAP
jgi:hypothetical protein